MTSDRLIDWFSRQWFTILHRNTMIYNACWEDPRLDRSALRLGPDDTLLTITSAGCNVLDFALEGISRVYAVDVNPRQNAVLELKIAAIRALDYETFFSLFGEGKHPDFPSLYQRKLRPLLSASAAAIWDKQQDYFAPRSSFYFRGSSGLFARCLGHYVDFTRVRGLARRIFDVTSLDEQQYLYHNALKKVFWTKFLKTALNSDLSLSLIGVPRTQRRQIEEEWDGGVGSFLESCLDAVFGKLPLKDNYFWWLYFNGAYSKNRCPRYLEREHFEKLKGGLVDRIEIATSTLVDFLRAQESPISAFVLLDHMDWLRERHKDVLQAEWQHMVRRAVPGARFLWRSSSLSGNFVDEIPVRRTRNSCRVGDVLRYDNALATKLHALDRVHTYSSLSIATFHGA